MRTCKASRAVVGTIKEPPTWMRPPGAVIQCPLAEPQCWGTDRMFTRQIEDGCPVAGCGDKLIGDSLVVIIALTGSCDLRCVYCAQEHAPQRWLPAGDWTRWLDNVRTACAPRRMAVNVYGGEPLLHPEIGDVLAWFRESQCAMWLTTNLRNRAGFNALRDCGLGSGVTVCVSMHVGQHGWREDETWRRIDELGERGLRVKVLVLDWPGERRRHGDLRAAAEQRGLEFVVLPYTTPHPLARGLRQEWRGVATRVRGVSVEPL